MTHTCMLRTPPPLPPLLTCSACRMNFCRAFSSAASVSRPLGTDLRIAIGTCDRSLSGGGMVCSGTIAVGNGRQAAGVGSLFGTLSGRLVD